MAATLTVVADSANEPPRMVLTVAGASGTSVTVQRVDQSGNVSEVRTATPAALVSGGWIGVDIEAPYNQPLTYQAVTSAGTVVSASATLAVGRSWLVHPGIPGLSVPLTVREAPTMTRASGRGLYAVLGRAEMVARSDGQRKARTFDLTVRTDTAADEDALNTLLDDDSVLLLQVASAGIYRSSYYWVSIGDATQAPLIQQLDGRWVWTLPCVEAARPAGLLQSQITWADVIAGSPTWADVVAGYGSWRDVILGNSGSASLAVVADAVVVTDSGGGTLTLTGSGVADNGAGLVTLSLTSPGDVDNGNGTLTLI